MGLSQPNTIDYTDIPLLMLEDDTSYTDPMMGHAVNLHISVGRLFELRPTLDEHGNKMPARIKIEQLPGESLQNYIMCQRIMNSCAQNGEGINQRLIRAVGLIYGPILKIENQFNCEYTPTYVAGFMKLKNLFIDYIKSHAAYKHLVPKEIRREFEWFVIYRNIFTHGKLRDIKPGHHLYCIQYVDHTSKKEVYVRFNLQMISDFQETYLKFIHVLTEYEKIKGTLDKAEA
jgi:hypothetical protein